MHPHPSPLPEGEGVLWFQDTYSSSSRRIRRGVIADEIASGQLAIFAEWRLERQRHACRAPRLVDALGINVQVLRHFVDRRLATQLRRQLALGARRLGQELGHVYWQA